MPFGAIRRKDFKQKNPQRLYVGDNKNRFKNSTYHEFQELKQKHKHKHKQMVA